MNYILCESIKRQKYNASKARTDAKIIAVKAGYKEIVLFHSGYPKPFVICEIILGCIRTVCRAEKDDNVFFQYPYYPALVNRIIISILVFGKKLKKYKVTMLIHDAVSLRSMVKNHIKSVSAIRDEISVWTGIDKVICHNEKMKNMFEETGVKNNFSVLGPFYYLYDGKICKREFSQNPVVMIAGNLSKDKCGYIYQLSGIKDVEFDLFGTNYTGTESEHIRYRGLFDPVELISHLDGQFGLVWDGDTVDTCSGDYGEYLRYNNPHKFSLYLAAGVPLIVWKESALAVYVEEKNIGICVESLFDLKKAFKGLSSECYNRMVRNVLEIRKTIINGQNLRELI